MTVSTIDSKNKKELGAEANAYRRLLSRYLGPQKGRTLLMAFFVFGGIAAQLVNPQIIRYFLDAAKAGEAGNRLVNAALVFMGLAILQQAFGLAATYTSQMVSWTATNRLRTDLTLHCLKLDMSFHKRRTPGELIERIDGDVTQLANFFSMLVIEVLSNALLVIGILILLFREDFRVGLGLTAYTMLTFAALGSIQKLAVSRWAEARQAIAEQNGFVEERISGIEDIQVNGAEAYSLRRLYELLRVIFYKMRSAFVVGQFTYNLTNLIYVIGYAIGLALAVTLYSQGSASIGTAYLVVFYVGMLSEPIQSIRRQVQDLQQATANITRVEELLAFRPIVGDRPEASRQLYPGALAVEFQSVSFRYDSDASLGGEDGNELEQVNENVLSEVSFHLKPGRVLGILGRTGSGKSTLTRLLFRLYDPTSGCILIDGIDVRDVPLADIRKRVGLVTQDVQLFEASIRDNLTFFDKAIPDDRLEKILQDLNLWDWMKNLPEGLTTRLGSGGQGLSAGEAQLLAFARVFVKNPGLIVLDEASSRLDPATEARMERAIDRLFRDRTGVIIAHHLKTVNRADEILILEEGRVIEYGSRVDLAADPSSHYAGLLKTGLEEVMA
jgi:ATP-binding cassette, subfamily B, bacterial